MTTLVPDKRHPALDMSEPERADYLTVVASMAYADLDTSAEELERLGNLCDDLELAGEPRERVLASAAAPTQVDVDRIVAALAPELRHALLVDTIDLAYADRTIEASEVAAIERIADRIGVPRGQLALIHRYVKGQRMGARPPSGGNLIAMVVALAVPIAAFALASASGTDTAVAAGIAAGAALVSFIAVKLLFRSGRQP
jgi:uncharacterized tellurite resistance protein B-like protein